MTEQAGPAEVVVVGSANEVDDLDEVQAARPVHRVAVTLGAAGAIGAQGGLPTRAEVDSFRRAARPAPGKPAPPPPPMGGG